MNLIFINRIFCVLYFLRNEEMHSLAGVVINFKFHLQGVRVPERLAKIMIVCSMLR